MTRRTGNRSLGEILVEQKAITAGQLETALAEQSHLRKRWGLSKPLGRFLIETGCIGIREYLAALSKHFDMPVRRLDTYRPDPDCQKAIGLRYAIENKVIVLEMSENTAHLALAEPSVQLLEELRKTLPARTIIKFSLASHADIDHYLRAMEEMQEPDPAPARRFPAFWRRRRK